jgi:diguanylate cyclase (GGDEF)-like protein
MPALRRDGAEFPVEVSLHHWRQGGSPFYGAILRDMAERHRVEAHIRHLAHHDSLTDLPNREVFHDRLREAVAATQAGDPGFALVLVDLDRFKDVNDTYGHSAGDALLREAAERLRAACTSDRCSTARVGGDVFALLLAGVPEPAAAVAAAARSIEALSRPFRVEEGGGRGRGQRRRRLVPHPRRGRGRPDDQRRPGAQAGEGREPRPPFLFDPAMGTVASARRALCDELRRRRRSASSGCATSRRSA